MVSFHLLRNLVEVFIYNHMSLLIRSHVKAPMVLTRANHLFINNYHYIIIIIIIRSLLNIILRLILMAWMGIEPGYY